MQHRKKVIVSVTNDLISDQRVHKVCTSLHNSGVEVLLVGRKVASSLKLSNRPYETKRFNLWFNKGVLFYANYNLRLAWFLLFSKFTVLISNDLDTLLANFLISRIKNQPLIYDSHEYFTEVPELINRTKTKKVWETIEGYILPKLKYAYTVSSLIAEAYNHKYNTKFLLIRNFPRKREVSIQSKEKIILYQGVLNVGRGLEDMISAMQFIDDYKLWIAGTGDLENDLKQMVLNLKLDSKVRFLGRIPLEILVEITDRASLGLSLETITGLNYKFALPNKIFDYLQSKVPVLYADLPEVEKTLAGFEVGSKLKSREPQKLAEQVKGMLNSDQYEHWVKQCSKAAEQLNWETEERVLLNLFDSID